MNKIAQQNLQRRLEMDLEVTLALRAPKPRSVCSNSKHKSMGRLRSLLCLPNARCSLLQSTVLILDLHASQKDHDVAQWVYSGVNKSALRAYGRSVVYLLSWD